MKPEIELRFYPIDKRTIRKKLIDLGATKTQPERTMRRRIYTIGDENAWLRVRDEGNQITVTLKKLYDPSRIDGIHELEIVVNNYQAACELFKQLQFKPLGYQENLRETWSLNYTKVTIDTWPGLKPLIEIEGNTKDHVYSVALQLKLDPDKANRGTVKTIYLKEFAYTSEEFDAMDLTLKTLDP